MVNNIHSNQVDTHLQVSNNTHLPKAQAGDVQSASFMLNMHQALTAAAEGSPKDLDESKDWEKYFNGSSLPQEKGSGDSIQKLEDQFKEIIKQLKDPKLSKSEKLNLCMSKLPPLEIAITEAQMKQQGEKIDKLQKELTNPNLTPQESLKIQSEIKALNQTKVPNSPQIQELQNEMSKEMKNLEGGKP